MNFIYIEIFTISAKVELKSEFLPNICYGNCHRVTLFSVGKYATVLKISYPPTRPHKIFWTLSSILNEDALVPFQVWQRSPNILFHLTLAEIKWQNEICALRISTKSRSFFQHPILYIWVALEVWREPMYQYTFKW